MRSASLLALFVGLALALVAPATAAQDRAASAAAAAGIVEGARFPSLRLPRLDSGAPTSLSDFRGERVVLHVFASW